MEVFFLVTLFYYLMNKWVVIRQYEISFFILNKFGELKKECCLMNRSLKN